MLNKKIQKRIKRHKKIRSRLSGTAETPRISVFKSNKGLYVQVIDDIKAETLLSLRTKDDSKDKKVEQAAKLGKELGKKMSDKSIKKAVFDRGGNKYVGRIKALAEGIREGGVKF